jgi:hypothetical protein
MNSKVSSDSGYRRPPSDPVAFSCEYPGRRQCGCVVRNYCRDSPAPSVPPPDFVYEWRCESTKQDNGCPRDVTTSCYPDGTLCELGSFGCVGMRKCRNGQWDWEHGAPPP